jgi:pyruvate ferredoxin oxidoreductase gamma subunit/phenylglyoxylate dehydrogenase gamma subunit
VSGTVTIAVKRAKSLIWHKSNPVFRDINCHVGPNGQARSPEGNPDVHEIRIHGRGGQGAVLAGSILATAFVQEGRHVVAVPSFGFERRGAPVASFLRVDDRPIRQMTNIYRPDCILCIDPTVSRAVNVFEGVTEGATLVQTTTRPLAELAVPERVSVIGLCDAVTLALAIFKRPITNTLMLGAFAKTTGLVSLDSLRIAIEQSHFRDAGLAQNLEALAAGFERTTVCRRERRAAA